MMDLYDVFDAGLLDAVRESREPRRFRSYRANNDACVEIALAGPAVAVRDSKNPTPAWSCCQSRPWRSFLRSAR